MLRLLKRLFGKEDPGAYMRNVCALLQERGFNPLWLEELLPDATGLKVSRIFIMLQNRGFSVPNAAKTIEVATHFYNQYAEQAEAQGWPLKHESSDPSYSRSEAYFIEHVAEAAVAVQKRR